MKTKQEQIEEMAVLGCVRNPQAHTAEECSKCDFKQGMCNAYRHAEALYNAGYRREATMIEQEQVNEMTKERNEIKDIMKLLDKCVSLNPMCKSEVASVLYGNNYRKAEEITKFDKLCRDYNKLLYIIRCNMTSITRYIRNENKAYDIRYKELAEKAVENILEAINHRGKE